MPNKHKLRTARDGANLTQRELKELSGVSTSTISHIECHRGPDVPRDQLRTTKTKLSTAIKLMHALNNLPPGQYSLDDFVAGQSVFSKMEIYEAVRKQYTHGGRHLRAVA